MTSQFENKFEVNLEAYYFFRGDNIIEQFIICLIDIQEKYEVNEKYHDQGSNRKFLASFNIPIFIHSLLGCGGHLLIDKAYLFGAKSLNIIPMSAYRYSSFQIGKLHFMDSMKTPH